MGDQINVSFKVAGSELSAFLDQIQKKSDALTNSAIKGALAQNEAGKINLKIIEDQIKAIERKTRVETQAARSILLDKRESELGRNRDTYDGHKNRVFSDDTLSDEQKKEKIQSLEGSEKAGEQKIKDNYRESLNVVKEQERQAKLQTSLAKENISTLKETADKNVKAITSGDIKLADVIKSAQTDEEKLVARITEEGVNKGTDDSDPDNTREKKQSITSGILGAENINRIVGLATQVTQTKNGIDLIAPTMRTVGTWFGSIFGDLIGKITGEVSGAAGEFFAREATAKNDYLKEVNRFGATSGSDFTGNTNMVGVGVDATAYLKMQTDFAKRRGYSSKSDETARDAVYAEKGYGVDQGTSNQIVEMQRSAREGNRDLAGLISGVLEKGQGNIFKNGDNTFLNEFLGKFTTLQKELLKSQTNVSTGTTMDILSRFNKVGGEFDVRDPRGMNNINAIQNGLSNPGSENMKAMAFRILSQQNPNMGMFDLKEEMSKGLGSPGYMKGVLGMIDKIGGDDQTKMMNLNGAFGGLSPAAVRTLFNNKEGLMNGNISVENLQARFPKDFKTEAENKTTTVDKTSANIETKLLAGMMESSAAMVNAFKQGVSAALSGAVININDGQGTIEFKGKAPIFQNATKSQSKSGSKWIDNALDWILPPQ